MIQHLHREQISKVMEESGLTSGNNGWLQKYHKTVTDIINSLGGEEKVSEEYGKVAKQWNEEAPPDELRQK